MEKLLALAQHLNISFIEDDGEYYFGVSQESYENYVDYYSNEEEKELIEPLDWVKEQDNYIDFESEVEINGHYYTYEGKEYLILDNSEADDHWEQSVGNYIDECILPDLPEKYQCYFDRKAFMQDCRLDGRGHSLSGYDGIENEETVAGTTYYIYRTN